MAETVLADSRSGGVGQGRESNRVSIDLGCGEYKQEGAIGVDCFPHANADYVCQLGFEPLPFPDNHADLITANDFLEHLPKIATSLLPDGKWISHYPHIQLLNEIWRVLKPNGVFESLTPVKEPALHGRPTHVSVWNQETFEQFTKRGDDFLRGHMKSYGFSGEFKILSMQESGPYHLHVMMRAVK